MSERPPLPEPLRRYPVPNYLEGHVLRAHLRGLVAGSGPQHDLRLFADALHALAERYAGGAREEALVGQALQVFRELLSNDRGGLDGGTCDAWAAEVAAHLGLGWD
jgi:hypothetical protein